MRTALTAPSLWVVFGLVLSACGAEPANHTEHAIDWSEPVAVDSGQAHQGPWRMNESRFLYVDDPAVALTTAGVAMVWVDNAEQRILFQRYDEDGRAELDEPAVVTRSPDVFSWLPRIAADGDHIYVAWEEILFTGGSHGGEILVASSGDGGRSFAKPVNLSNTTAGAGKGRLTRRHWDNGSLDLAVTADGRVIVAWTEYEGALRLAWSERGGDAFSEPLHVAGSDEDPARAPALAIGPDGRIWLAWTMGGSPAGDIHLAYSDALTDGFSEPQAVHRSTGHADAPRLVVDDDGSLHLVYAQGETAPFHDSQILYARGSDQGFDEPVIISRLPDYDRAVAAYPQLAMAAGRLIATWEQAARTGVRPAGIGYAVSDNDGEFGPAMLVPGDFGAGRNGGNQGLLMRKLDGNAGGRIALGHVTFLDGEASHVWLLPGRVAGDNHDR